MTTLENAQDELGSGGPSPPANHHLPPSGGLKRKREADKKEEEEKYNEKEKEKEEKDAGEGRRQGKKRRLLEGALKKTAREDRDAALVRCKNGLVQVLTDYGLERDLNKLKKWAFTRNGEDALRAILHNPLDFEGLRCAPHFARR